MCDSMHCAFESEKSAFMFSVLYLLNNWIIIDNVYNSDEFVGCQKGYRYSHELLVFFLLLFFPYLFI